MKIHKISMEGVRHLKPINIELDPLGPCIIAVAGLNGSGKTTFLEAMCPGLFFRELPSRTTTGVASQFPSGQGHVRLDFTLGNHRYLAELRCRNGTILATLEKDGKAQVSGKLREFDEAIKALIGTSEALYASVYGIQGGQGRLSSLSGPSRKEVFRHYLGLGRVEALFDAVKLRQKQLVAEAARIADAREMLPTLESAIGMIEAQLPEAAKALPASEKKVAAARAALEAFAASAELEKAYRTWQEQMLSLQGQMSKIITEGEPIKGQIAKAQADLDAIGDVEEEPIDPEWFAAEQARIDAMVKAQADFDRVVNAVAVAERELARTKSQAAKLCEVPCGGVGKYASCGLIADATRAQAALPTVEENLKALSDSRDELKAKVKDPSKLKANLEAQRKLDQEETRLRQQKVLLTERIKSLSERHVALIKSYKEAKARADDHQATQPAMPESTAEARRQAEMALREADREKVSAVQFEAGLKQDLKSKVEALAKVKATLAAAGDTAAEIDELAFLARALGPDGVQAAEIGAAGPEISRMANRLLMDSFEGRFSVEIAVREGRKSGSGSIEDVCILVTDEEKPEGDPARVRDLGDYSGGQQVVIDEAIRTALATFANERLSVPFQTLWRDESAGALDPENANRYVAMLREARSSGRYNTIFFVAQQPEVYEAADYILWFEDGSVTVRAMR
jgi:exonuclease SbcC